MNNNHIIKMLKEERKALKKKIEAIESALIGFGDETSPNQVSEKKQARNQSKSKGTRRSSKGKKEHIHINIPDEYHSSASWPEKIAFVLSEKTDGATSDEIVERILQLDPVEKEMEKNVYSAVTQHSSKMYRIGQINAARVGRKYRYQLKKRKEAS